MLWKAVKEILEVAGYNVLAIEQELFQPNIRHMVTPSPRVDRISSFVSCAEVNEVAKSKGGDKSRDEG